MYSTGTGVDGATESDKSWELTEEEIKNHQKEGEPAIKKLASAISSTPKDYTARKIKIPHAAHMNTALPKEL